MLPEIENNDNKKIELPKLPKKEEVVNENSLRVKLSETGPGSDNVE